MTRESGHWVHRESLLQDGFVMTCEVPGEVASSNTLALQRARTASEHELPWLIVPGHQTAGRGRGQNSWWFAEGAIACSLLLAPSRFDLPPNLWATLSVVVGSAICSAVSSFSGSIRPRLKWPNDVFLADRKLCGVLVESLSPMEDRLVIGIGLNVNNSFRDSPRELAEKGISLKDVLGKELDRMQVLRALLQRLQFELQRLSSRDPAQVQTWRTQCLLTGRQVKLQDHLRRVEGTCLGIDDDGALRLLTQGGPQRFLSGVIVDFD